ncbi:MAG TPA: histidine phosphatase family protein [Candidatus Dormibacteraeota bacterium]
MPTRIFLVRHAEVLNPDGVLYGHLDRFPLSSRGRLQATEIGRRLRDEGVRRIAHSPLLRAIETAQLINRELPHPVPLIEEPGLVEAEFGRYLQGVKPWQVPFRRPLWFVHKARRGLLPGDETIAGMGERVMAVARRYALDHPDQVTVCVSHADPLQAAWILLDGRPQTEVEMYRKSVARAGVLEVDFDPAGRVVGVSYVPPPEVALPSTPEPEVPRTS